jgi:hypothetical protein
MAHRFIISSTERAATAPRSDARLPARVPRHDAFKEPLSLAIVEQLL